MNDIVMHGVIHGKIIELDHEAGIADGESVEIVVRRVNHPSTIRTGIGFTKTEGALVNDSEWDGIMQEVQQARKLDHREDWEAL